MLSSMESLKRKKTKKARSGFVITADTGTNAKIMNTLANVREGNLSPFEGIKGIKSLKNNKCMLLDAYERFVVGEISLNSMLREIETAQTLRSVSQMEDCEDKWLDKARIILMTAKLSTENKFEELQSLLRVDDPIAKLIQEVVQETKSVEEAHEMLTEGKSTIVVDVEAMEQVDTGHEGMKEISKIYYPSSDDPDSIEICYSATKSLAPQAYLSSTIMNFYMKYLQQPTSPTDRPMCDYHFFNTYFYDKMKVVGLNRSDNESLFVKFRRWWRGTEIFHKAYILVPIHENLLWSLIIICIPEKEEQSGPFILHLDTVGLHPAKQILNNIRSFLREEWKCLQQGDAPPNVPISERVWKNLPRRTVEKTIKVPQQTEAYDSGLSVLFFIERFIDEAPKRLKREDLATFGKNWFNPEEVSNLRQKIRKLLVEEFQRVVEEKRLSTQ